jgi:hypothetical protein
MLKRISNSHEIRTYNFFRYKFEKVRKGIWFDPHYDRIQICNSHVNIWHTHEHPNVRWRSALIKNDQKCRDSKVSFVK